MMRAVVGDRLIVLARHLEEGKRIGEILEVHGPDGGPPYVVRWHGELATALVVPGPDAHPEHLAESK